MFRSARLVKTSQNKIASPRYYLKKFCIERPNKDISGRYLRRESVKRFQSILTYKIANHSSWKKSIIMLSLLKFGLYTNSILSNWNTE